MSSAIEEAVNFLTTVCGNILNSIDDDVELWSLLTNDISNSKDALFLMVKYNIIKLLEHPKVVLTAEMLWDGEETILESLK